MKPNLVIVGAGLGGCILADALSDLYNIFVVESPDIPNTLYKRVRDVGVHANLIPVASNGLGGTTNFWHNGLIEIDDFIFKKYWPYSKVDLLKYYEKAYLKLSGISKYQIDEAIAQLQKKLESCGIPAHLMRHGLYYPRRRINPWNKFKLLNRVNLIYGSVQGLTFYGDTVKSISINHDNKDLKIEADFFVLAAGGLGTPVILQELVADLPPQATVSAGFYYEDHPTGFIGRLVLKPPLYKYANFSIRSIDGFLRMPLVIEQDGYLVSFQLRPSAQVTGKSRITSLLTQIRNYPMNISNYLRVLMCGDDLLEIVSLKLGINFPTHNYAVLVVSEQPIVNQLGVSSSLNKKEIIRNWSVDSEHIALIERAFTKLVLELGVTVEKSEIFPDWSKFITSSAHHSGGARMSSPHLNGVCDENGQVHGLNNLFICDGSLIPASGFANTGLTIGALALKLADFLKNCLLK
ncbi:GMC family oxidoreductase [Polynucleobacter paneuropaeus]|nr:GMC family oxidoreductase [Polynucleobacter paneuropaeus]MBT8583021.1 GMC family oxidoreductase [Polynucleobacter paneuropaeus]